MGREDGVCMYNGKLFSLSKEVNLAYGTTWNKSSEHYAKCNKLVTEDIGYLILLVYRI